ncbi:outer membrane protein [Flaviflagellibacter deserti]|jgi:outer membrane immunogenic protein|uniref:Outer membrane protein n=1 Tax=Flaviflagellibacter deserti TaxID=2267266 RepID=A0ABV9Z2R3_9HYPH
MKPLMRIVGAAAILVWGGAASAADYPMATTSEFVNWTGAYFGGFGGYAAGEITADADTAPYDAEYDLNFALGGVEFGYNHQFGQFVVGGEIDISFTDGDTSETLAVGEYESNIDWLATFRLRAGYAWNNLLIYATGGFAAAETDDRFLSGGAEEETTGSRKGWTAGAGFEWAFYDKWSVKGEYLFVDLGDDEAIQDPNGVLPVGFGSSVVEHQYHVGKVGINYHF